jgi:hypothetical protein
MSSQTGTTERTRPQILAAVVGAVFLLIGILGFFVTGFENFASHTDKTLLGFEVNPLHNIVHLLIGAAGLVMARTLSLARVYGWLLVIAYGLTFLYGLWAVNRTDGNFLSINSADNWLHLITVLAGVGIILLPAHPGSPVGRHSSAPGRA